jgi:hypothetical protein
MWKTALVEKISLLMVFLYKVETTAEVQILEARKGSAFKKISILRM